MSKQDNFLEEKILEEIRQVAGKTASSLRIPVGKFMLSNFLPKPVSVNDKQEYTVKVAVSAAIVNQDEAVALLPGGALRKVNSIGGWSSYLPSGANFFVWLNQDQVQPIRVQEPPAHDPSTSRRRRTAPAAGSEEFVVKPARGVKVREGPGTWHKEIDGLPQGEVVKLLERQADWGRFAYEYSGRGEGWIRLDNLSRRTLTSQ